MDIVHVEKYYKQIKERFPYLSEKQIDKICIYGLRSFYMHNAYGADVIARDRYGVIYFGKLFKKFNVFWQYHRIKWQIKYRIKYKRAKTIWNGKYYFGIYRDDYENLYKENIQRNFDRKKKKKSRGKVHFEKIRLFKILEECELFSYAYIFELDYPYDVGFSCIINDVSFRNFKMIKKYNINTHTFEPVSEEGK